MPSGSGSASGSVPGPGTTWASLFDRAKRRYGLVTDSEDALLVDRLFLDRVNELFQEAAEQTGAFRESFTLNLTTAAAHALDRRVIRVLNGTVRVDYDGSGSFAGWPDAAPEEALRQRFGPLENEAAGVPAYYYMRRGTVGGSLLLLCLFPASDTLRPAALQFQAEVYAPPVTAGVETLPVQFGEERHLVPGICVALAQAEFSRGPSSASGAKVEHWRAEWEAALVRWKDTLEDMQQTRDGRRIRYADGAWDGLYY